MADFPAARTPNHGPADELLPPTVHEERALPAPSMHAAGLESEAGRTLDRLLLEARAVQRRRWQTGERVLAEAFLAEFPALRLSQEHVLELIYAEYRLREESGEQPNPTEYAARFPEYAERWQMQIALHQALAIPDLPPSTDPSEADAMRDTRTAALPGSATKRMVPAVDGYEVLDVLGRGGMGVVYKARQRGLDRLVALKMILAAECCGPEHLARFRAEARTAAGLHHPHIVQVYDIGEQQEGRPYFSLEYVEGGSLAEKLDGAPLSPRAAAQFAATIAQTIDFAHQHGVIHRDLKPANVLLTANGVPKITDFGLAKVLREVGVHQTQSGAILGTPSYMAPEQAAGTPRAVGPAADVYSVGAILYEMLTGRPPFRAATPMDTVLQVLHSDPVSPARFQPRLPRDLETICLKCLEKDPHRRYRSAAALANDLQRFLDGESIQARPVGALEWGWKWAKRRPALAGLAGVSLVAVLALGMATAGLMYSNRLHHERDAADQLRQEAEGQRQEAERQRQRVQQLQGLTRRYRYDAEMQLAEQAWEAGDVQRLLEQLEGQRPEATEGEDLRGFEWHHLWRRAHQDLLTLRGHHGVIFGVAFSPDGRRVATASGDGTAKVWDAQSGLETLTLRGHHAPLSSLTFNLDGSQIATSSFDNTVRVWEARTGREIRTLKGHAKIVHRVAFSPRGNRLATASSDRLAKVWDTHTGREILTLRGHTSAVRSVAFSPDGARLATASADKTVKIWDARTGRDLLTLQGHQENVIGVAFSPDGTRLASTSGDKTARIWNASTGRHLRTLEGHQGNVYAPVFSPNGHSLATASADKTTKVWNVQTGQQVLTLLGHQGQVVCVAYSADGGHLMTGSDDKTAKVWDAREVRDVRTLKGHSGIVLGVAHAPDGRLATASGDRTVKVWDTGTGRQTLVLAGHRGPVYGVAFSPDGRRLATASADRTIKVWDAQTGREILTLTGRSQAVWNVAFSPRGRRLAAASIDHTATIWDARTGKQLLVLKGHPNTVNSVAFSPDGLRLATATINTVKVWDAHTGRGIVTLQGHRGLIQGVTFSPDGVYLATASADNTAILWDAQTGRAILTLKGHLGQVSGVAFSPDGSRLATASFDHTAKVWDVQTGRTLLTLKGHKWPVSSVTFSPDGSRLVTGSWDKTAKVWDGRPGSWPGLRHGAP